jgi:hypothetical protein
MQVILKLMSISKGEGKVTTVYQPQYGDTHFKKILVKIKI